MPLPDVSDPPAAERRFAVIIGGMKCGTTSLFEILRQHPDIAGIAEKDKDFFASSGAEEEPEEYLRQWPDGSGGQLLLDASVSYTKAPFVSGVPERILRSGLGDWRFVYMIREPVSRIESQIRHGLYAGWGKSADEGLTPDLLFFSRYAFQLDAWAETFSRESIRVVILDEFEQDPRAVLRDLCDFLGVDPDFEFRAPQTRYNEGDFFESPKLVRAAATNPTLRRVVKALVPRAAVNWARRVLASLADSSPSNESSSLGRWKLTDQETAQVLAHLDDDTRRLRDEYSVDVCPWWSARPPDGDPPRETLSP